VFHTHACILASAATPPPPTLRFPASASSLPLSLHVQHLESSRERKMYNIWKRRAAAGNY